MVLPVSDVDRARDFYQSLGWRLDATPVDAFGGAGPARLGVLGHLRTQVTRPRRARRRACSSWSPTSPARAELAARGADLSEVFHDATGVFHHAGTQARVPGPAEDHQTYGSWVSFSDPDGNTWFVQEVTTRLPGRATSALASFDSVAGLAAALRRAAAAHGRHEEETGRPTRTGRTGTRSTWRTSRPGRQAAHDGIMVPARNTTIRSGKIGRRHQWSTSLP